MSRLYGHQTAEKQLKQAYDAGRLHHAVILTGIDGVGKETLAHRLIDYTIAYPAGNPSQDSLNVEKQMAADGHPNVFNVQPVFDEKKLRFKRDITLDALKGLNKYLRLMAQNDIPRFIVIKPADGMNLQTQNSLLKMLEEPPPRTHFLLITAQPGALLATIRSRCLTINLSPLALEDFASGMAYLLPHVDDHKITALYRLSHGALGQAIEDEHLDLPVLYGQFCGAVAQWHNNKDSLPAMALAEQLSRTGNEEPLAKLLDTISGRLSLFIKNAVTQNTAHDHITPEEQTLFAFWQQLTPLKLLAMQERIISLWQSAEQAYLDKKIVLLQIFAIASGMDT